MKPEELMLMPTKELAALDDSQLGNLLADLLPAVRAEFVGQKEEAVVTANGVKISARAAERNASVLLNILKSTGAASQCIGTESTEPILPPSPHKTTSTNLIKLT